MARILIADDNLAIRSIYEDLLDYLGHEVISCKDGQEALEKFAVEHVDLMILDVQMPNKTGPEVCREIRQQPRGLNIPIIIASSCQGEEEILEGLSAGANDYLIKPVKESHLIARLKNLLHTSIIHNSDYELARSQVVFVDRYKIRKILGCGRHSIVYEVDDLKEDNKKKVLKLLNDTIKDPEVLTDYLATARNISKIDSDYITKTLETGQYAGRCYLIMEYLAGGDLRELFTYRKLSFKEAVHIGNDISRGINDLRHNGIVHFDIKPENILISAEGHFKIADFGMLTKRDSVTMPMNAEIWSTAAYVAPEYINAEHDLSSKCDVYSLGVTLYEGLVGDNPFLSDKPMNSLFRQTNIQAPDLDSLGEDIPKELSDVIKIMLVKNPELRPKADKCVEIFSALMDPDKYSWISQKRQNPEVKHRMERDFGYNEKAIVSSAEAEKSMQVLEDFTKQIDLVAGSSSKNQANIAKEDTVIPKKTNILKVIILGAVCLFLAILIGAFISSMFTSQESSQNNVKILGPLTIIECPGCKHKLEKRCKDVSKEKCPKCSAVMVMAMECMKCGKRFAGKKQYYDSQSDAMECPSCKSKDTSFSRAIKIIP